MIELKIQNFNEVKNLLGGFVSLSKKGHVVIQARGKERVRAFDENDNDITKEQMTKQEWIEDMKRRGSSESNIQYAISHSSPPIKNIIGKGLFFMPNGTKKLKLIFENRLGKQTVEKEVEVIERYNQ